ncbi:tetratricopeptide repeat protein [Roseisolibacter sp. H3M3-2]|uniref:tetratricopeptide repeat protein n=1 Tax=Roseisolibacter sp. H3M3-2 TaxID=3031323 RepID=UPI0023D98840|nr:tetratricopeptide repeat protein [Roseisolibacter sp. H3M3-2]MDF1504520.1 tetratricopeptide repeat protein [Roseisolibacter sp. H3M3-2]
MPDFDRLDWVNDFSVQLDDEEMLATVGPMEAELLYRGSRLGAALWLALLGTVGALLGALSLSPAIRASAVAFVGFLAAAFAVLRAARPVTRRLFDPCLTFHAGSAIFWSVLLAWAVMLGIPREATWAAYTLGVGGGLLVGLVRGSVHPNTVRNEDVWMLASLLLAPAAAWAAVWAARHPLGGLAPLELALAAGGIVAALWSVPMEALLMAMWRESNGLAQLARVFLHNERYYDRALAAMDRAIALDPKNPELHDLRATVHAKLGNADRAEEDRKRVVDFLPKNATGAMNRGVDAMGRGDYDAAVALLRHAAALGPKDPMIHSNLGAALEKRGDFDEAIAAYDRALALKPKYPNALANRAYAYHRRGDHARAIEDCERALALRPDFANAMVNRGHALAALGDRDAAARSFREALDSRPPGSVRDEALQALDALETPGAGAPAGAP